MQKDHIRTLKILLITSEFGGLWKHQNNPVFRKLKLDTILKKKKKKKKHATFCMTAYYNREC